MYIFAPKTSTSWRHGRPELSETIDIDIRAETDSDRDSGPRLRTETRDRDSRLETESPDRDSGLETRDKILHFWWFPGLSQNITNPVS